MLLYIRLYHTWAIEKREAEHLHGDHSEYRDNMKGHRMETQDQKATATE
jgi:hypothetical protein